jgi:catechol-2,3-dioxygenase
VGEVVYLTQQQHLESDEPVDMETLQTNFRKQLASLFIAGEFNDIPRDWMLKHLKMVVGNIEESLTPEGRAREKEMFGGQAQG